MRCVGDASAARRGSAEASAALWRCVDAALADAAEALRASLDARAYAAKRKVDVADAAPATEEEATMHWELTEDVGKVLAYHLAFAPDTAAAAQRQMAAGALRDACHACAGGLGAPAAESLWRCVALGACAHAPCGVAARSIPGFRDAFSDAKRCALRGSVAASPLLGDPDEGGGRLVACLSAAQEALTSPAPTTATAPHRAAAEALELLGVLRRCADAKGGQALSPDGFDAAAVRLRAAVTSSLRLAVAASESRSEDACADADHTKRASLLRRLLHALDGLFGRP